jgi:UDP-N-acetyl-D-glucosamine dehydrogenase
MHADMSGTIKNVTQSQENCFEGLLAKIESKSITVAVVGLGYVGLPFLVTKAKAKLKVIGVDRNPALIAKLVKGENYISDVNDDDLKDVVDQGLVTASCEPSVLKKADVIVICVPTPLDKNLCPDLSFVKSVAKDIAKYWRPGQLVSLESTTYPGTTEEIIVPALEAAGAVIGETVFVSHSPERVDPGNRLYSTQNTNKVVGGVGEQSLKIAVAFYKLAIEHVVSVSSAKVA